MKPSTFVNLKLSKFERLNFEPLIAVIVLVVVLHFAILVKLPNIVISQAMVPKLKCSNVQTFKH